MPPRWTPLDPARPILRQLRELAGLSLGGVARALGRPDTASARATLSNTGDGDPQVSAMRTWADAVGLEVQIRVRKKDLDV